MKDFDCKGDCFDCEGLQKGDLDEFCASFIMQARTRKMAAKIAEVSNKLDAQTALIEQILAALAPRGRKANVNIIDNE